MCCVLMFPHVKGNASMIRRLAQNGLHGVRVGWYEKWFVVILRNSFNRITSECVIVQNVFSLPNQTRIHGPDGRNKKKKQD